jgi:hypothetical protein
LVYFIQQLQKHTKTKLRKFSFGPFTQNFPEMHKKIKISTNFIRSILLDNSRNIQKTKLKKFHLVPFTQTFPENHKKSQT